MRLALPLMLLVAPPGPFAAAQSPATAGWPGGEVRQATLSFDGKSTLGDFTGTTAMARGAMTGGATLADTRGWVEAPVQTLKTGNARRDRDLLKTMDAAVYPNIRFELAGVTPEWERGDSAGVLLNGQFVIHGVSRAERVKALISRDSAGIHVRADLPMNLHDYKIDRLTRFMVLSMNPKIVVHIDLVFSATGSAPAPVSTPPPAG